MLRRFPRRGVQRVGRGDPGAPVGLLATGEIDASGFIDLVAATASSPGHCNTMGTATTMNSLAEALGMSLPGCAAIPAPLKWQVASPTSLASASWRWSPKT